MNAQLSKRTRSQVSEFRPRVEHLEDRLCLDCKFFLAGMDTLTITDGKRASNNVVAIEDDGTDGTGNIKVTCDGVTKSFDSINNVLVRTGKGNDSVTYRFMTDTLSAARLIDIELGRGNDRAWLMHDQLDLLCELKIAIDGEAGKDEVGVTSGIGLDKNFDLDINGGEGKDILGAAIYIVRPKIGAGFDVDINGDEHDDVLALTLENFEGAPGDGTVDGGLGFDTCTASPGVIVLNCEA
jgi:hypothetical protein